MLKHKVKEIKQKSKIKIPLSLINYRKKKLLVENPSPSKDFPSLKQVLIKLRKNSDSPTRFCESFVTEPDYVSEYPDCLHDYSSPVKPPSHHRLYSSKSPRVQPHYRTHTPIQSSRMSTLKRVI